MSVESEPHRPAPPEELEVPATGMQPAAPQLGRLERHELRDIWTNEATGFTPWLAQPENLALLGDALGLTLELEAQERNVGAFRADILCKNVEDDHWVLIENQLERTDHGHLGQLLTYASGLEAVTIIWIAARFTEEHRSTLDWLNRITDDRFRFFGVEIELLRIGNSAPAPRFNIVAKPNSWSHSVADAARAIEEGGLSDLKIMQRDYWAGLSEVLRRIGGPIKGNKKPQPSYLMGYPTGRSGFRVYAVMLRPEKRLRAAIYLVGEHAKSNFAVLEKQKAAIEHDLGFPLEWEEQPGQQESRVSCYLDGVDPEDESDWPRQHEWLARHMNDLHRVFATYISTLSAGRE